MNRTPSITTGTASPRRARRLFRPLVAIVIVLIAAILPAASQAYVGESKSLPYFHGSGSAKITGYAPSGTASWRYGDGRYCIYIQYKYTAILGLDSSWSRLTSDNCGGYTSSASWSKPTSRPFNGVKFRLCQDIPANLDSCGSAVNIGY